MKLNSLLNHSAELLRIIEKSGNPADSISSQYFRSKKYLGSKDRRFISETVFCTLRNLRLNERCLNYAASNIDKIKKIIKQKKELAGNKLLILTQLQLAVNLEGAEKEFGYSPLEVIPAVLNIKSSNIKEIIAGLFESELRELDVVCPEFAELITAHALGLEEELKQGPGLKTISGRYSIPLWIAEKLSAGGISHEKIALIASSFNRPANLNIRARESIDRGAIIEILEKNGIIPEKSEISPSGIIIKKRVKIDSLEIFKNGSIEVQDAGSQLISYCLGPEPGKEVLDACAGAGGKTLHIASIQNDSGKITASDIGFLRLKSLQKRAARAGFTSIKTKLIKEKSDDYFGQLFDCVLVDSPCSGLGTARRNPMAKYYLSPKILDKHNKRQRQILQEYSKFVKPGGALAYATCSILPDENENIVKEFLEQNKGFKPSKISPVFKKFGIILDKLGEEDYYVTLYPDEYGTDGFFMARMTRENEQ